MHVIQTATPALIQQLKLEIEEIEKPVYEVGHAFTHLTKSAGVATLTHALAGRLYISKSGWLLLSVPNALVRGAFDALDEHGVELPPGGLDGRLNAHISVMNADEISKIGGPDKITERGHSYSYTLGPIKEVSPASWEDISKVWFIEVNSPELKALRKSYGLTPLPHDDAHPFHITIAVRRKKVLQENDKTKAAHIIPTEYFPEYEGERKDERDPLPGESPLLPAKQLMHFLRHRLSKKHKNINGKIEKEADKKKKPVIRFSFSHMSVSVLDGLKKDDKKEEPIDHIHEQAKKIMDEIMEKFHKRHNADNHLSKKATSFLEDLYNKPVSSSRRTSVRVLLPVANNKYLLQKAKVPGKFRTPGGGVEPTETLTQAAIRELNEEFGLDPKFTTKHLKYLGGDTRPQHAKTEHYFILPKHGLSARRYQASNDPREKIDLAAMPAKGEHYFGPDIDILIKHKPHDMRIQALRKKVANLLEVPSHATTENKSEVKKPHGNSMGMVLANRFSLLHKLLNKQPKPEIKQEEPKPVEEPKPLGPGYRVVALMNDQPIDTLEAMKSIPETDERLKSKPEADWLKELDHKGHNYWTEHGLRKYFDSGLFDWHRGLLNSDMAIMIANEIKKRNAGDEYRTLAGEDQPVDDTYFIDKGRQKPVTAREIMERHKPQFQTSK